MDRKPQVICRISSNSLLIINKTGKLQRIYVPFLVICIVAVTDIKKGEKVEVTAVTATKEVHIVYIIQGRPYAHYFFVVSM